MDQSRINAAASWLAACALALLAGGTSRVLAQDQFVLIDSTFTMTAQNTMQSQYAIAPLPAAPDSWKTPLDWSRGSMHVRFEILEKPSAAMTLTNVCFETGGVLTCQPYPPPYTAKGVFTSDDRLSTFWQFSVFDWSKKLDHVVVVIKDETGKTVQGNATFYPSKMRVTVTVVPPGKLYKDSGVVDTGEDGGVPLTAPKSDAGLAPRPAGATGVLDPSGVAGARAAGLTATDAGSTRSGTNATGSAGLSPLQVPDAGADRDIRDYIDSGSSCTALSARTQQPHALLLGFGLALASFVLRRRRR